MRGNWMKRFIVAVTLLVAVMAFNDAVKAQSTSDLATYQVAQDDHVWGIISAKCGEREAFNWRSYLDMPENSALKIPRSANAPRQFTTNKGEPGWLIYAGERIMLPTSKCNLATNTLLSVPAVSEISFTPVLTKADIEALLDQKLAGIHTGGITPWWLLVLLALAILALAVLLAREWQRRQSEAELTAARNNVEDMMRERISTLIDARNTAQRGQEALQDQLRTSNALHGRTLSILEDVLTEDSTQEFFRNMFDGGRPGANGNGHHEPADAPVTHISVGDIGDNTTVIILAGESHEVVTPEGVPVKEPDFARA